MKTKRKQGRPAGDGFFPHAVRASITDSQNDYVTARMKRETVSASAVIRQAITELMRVMPIATKGTRQ